VRARSRFAAQAKPERHETPPVRAERFIDATPGIEYYLKDSLGKTIPSGGILRVAVKEPDRVCHEYFTLVLNSTIVQKKIERDAGGSIINH